MCSLDTVVDQPIDRAEGAVREALAAQGFGVLTEIDVAATFEAKLGVTVRRSRFSGRATRPWPIEAAHRLETSPGRRWTTSSKVHRGRPQPTRPCARRKARCSSCISSGSRVNQSRRSGEIANASPSGGARWVRNASPTGQSRPSRVWLGYSM